MARQALILKVGTRPFPAMVKKADVIIGRFERFDLAFDKGIELNQIVCDVLWDGEIHGVSPLHFGRLRALPMTLSTGGDVARVLSPARQAGSRPLTKL